MDGYTPKVEDVRHEYAVYRDDLSEEEALARFNRMLAARDRGVARAAVEKAWDGFLSYKYLPPEVREYVAAYRLEQIAPTPATPDVPIFDNEGEQP